MRRAHVFERSVPRQRREAFEEPKAKIIDAARDIALRLPELLSKAESTGLRALAQALEAARVEAEIALRAKDIKAAKGDETSGPS